MILSESPHIEFLNCDNLQFMKDIPDNHFELAIVDPPYGIGAEHGTNRQSRKQFVHKEIGWDNKPPDKLYFDELRRISKHQIIWGGNYFLDVLGNCRGFIIWDKLNPDRCFADCEFAWTSFDSVARIFKPKRVQELNLHDKGKIHPTQKPTKLYEWILANYAQPGDKILDTHLGSASSALAAYRMGFHFTGMELDPDYFEASIKRFKAITSQIAISF